MALAACTTGFASISAGKRDSGAILSIVSIGGSSCRVLRRRLTILAPTSRKLAGMRIARPTFIGKWGGSGMSQDLAQQAAKQGIAYFLIAFVDLFGVMR